MLTRVSLSCLISSTRENLECKYYAEDSLIYKENSVETPSIQSSSKVRRDALQFLVILTCLYKNMVNYRELETLRQPQHLEACSWRPCWQICYLDRVRLQEAGRALWNME